jgi:hypothetical protein
LSSVLRICRVFNAAGGVEGLGIAPVNHGLSPHLEIGNRGVVFSAPEGTRYRTESRTHR